MKNVSKNQMKNCIYLTLEEIQEILFNVTNGLFEIKYDSLDNEISFDNTKKAYETDTFWEKDEFETLSEYFDIEVSSIHADNNEYVGIWICYD